MSNGMRGWCDTAAIAARSGRREEDVVRDVLNGAYESPVYRNGKWFLKDEKATDPNPAKSVSAVHRTPMRGACPGEWHDLAVVPERLYEGVLYCSFDEAARRLGTSYRQVYEWARRRRLKTARHIRHHWYVSAAEVRYLANRRRRP